PIGIDTLAGLQYFRKHLLRASAHQPAAILADADRHGLVFFGIQAADHRRSRSQWDLMFAGAPPEENADSEPSFPCGHVVETRNQKSNSEPKSLPSVRRRGRGARYNIFL